MGQLSIQYVSPSLYSNSLRHRHTVMTSASCLANGVEYLCPPSSVELHLAPETLHDRALNLSTLRERFLADRDKLVLMIQNRGKIVLKCEVYVSKGHNIQTGPPASPKSQDVTSDFPNEPLLRNTLPNQHSTTNTVNARNHVLSMGRHGRRRSRRRAQKS